MKVGDRVTKANVWKYESAVGEILKITSEYVVVKWEGIPGHWHYTEQQAAKIEVINESR